MTKHLGILISPTGEKFYDAYGPMTTLRDRATRFASAEVATSAANHRFGRHGDAFWESERASRASALREHAGWTSRIEEVADDDERRSGHMLYDYASDDSKDRLYARIDAAGRVSWHEGEAGCHLWPLRDDAVAFTRGLPKVVGRAYAVDSY